MASETTAYDGALSHPEHELLATELWTYIHNRLPRFTLRTAVEIVALLGPRPTDDLKRLGKRLRHALEERGFAIKHAAALEAAARLTGHASWHDANRVGATHRLQLMPLSLGSLGDPGTSGLQTFESWMDLVPRLCRLCDEQLRKLSTKVVQVRFEANYVMLGTHLPSPDSPLQMQSEPLLTIAPTAPSSNWLDGAPAAFEALRRHLEEAQGIAVLDGVTSLQLCNRYDARQYHGTPAGGGTELADVRNTELVLMREDNELSPHHGFEIARGDELTCWAQLEMAMRDHSANAEVIQDGEAWRIGGGRYVWDLVTLHPRDYTAGLTTRRLNEQDVERLLRRYKLAKRILGGAIRHHEVSKTLAYLAGPPRQSYRVNRNQVLQVVQESGYTWETVCLHLDVEQPLTPELPVGFIVRLGERLELKNPNRMFAVPSLAEMQRVDDDSVLRALLPRIDTVRFRLGSLLSDEAKAAAREAVTDLVDSLRVRKLSAAGVLVNPENELPQLVYGSDGEDLRAALEDQGLVAYACILPHFFSMDELRERMPVLENVSRYAFGHALFLHIDLVDEQSLPS